MDSHTDIPYGHTPAPSPPGGLMAAATAELIGVTASLVGLGVLTLISVRSISRRCTEEPCGRYGRP
ncbi:hypothetical protein [Streptomyces sp. NPDC002845]